VGREPQYQETGINGYIDDLLFPIHHGMLWYLGISVLPPHIIYQVHGLTEERLNKEIMAFEHRLATLENTPVLPYRYQNGGDYNDEQQLKEHLINGKSGLSIHLK